MIEALSCDKHMHAHIIALARTFPVLQKAPLDPWQPEALDAWAVGPSGTAGSRHAAAFVLSVWDPSSQQPIRAVTNYLSCDLEIQVKKVLAGVDELREAGPTTPHQRRQLRALEEELYELRFAVLRGDREKARGVCELLVERDDPTLQSLLRSLPDFVSARVDVLDVLLRLTQSCRWQVGPFIIAVAMSVWDGAQRAAFTAWAREPWLH